ncbi:hypothetical protein HK101_008251 [Irineochytrium annulatum]|nr:hypothetical protein HK101_008251 [Irineochytrium annulatum]
MSEPKAGAWEGPSDGAAATRALPTRAGPERVEMERYLDDEEDMYSRADNYRGRPEQSNGLRPSLRNPAPAAYRQPPPSFKTSNMISYGHGNVTPATDDLYMKSFNAKVPMQEAYPSTIRRIARTAAVNDEIAAGARSAADGAFRALVDAKQSAAKTGAHRNYQTEYQREFLDWNRSLLLAKPGRPVTVTDLTPGRPYSAAMNDAEVDRQQEGRYQLARARDEARENRPRAGPNRSQQQGSVRFEPKTTGQRNVSAVAQAGLSGPQIAEREHEGYGDSRVRMEPGRYGTHGAYPSAYEAEAQIDAERGYADDRDAYGGRNGHVSPRTVGYGYAAVQPGSPSYGPAAVRSSSPSYGAVAVRTGSPSGWVEDGHAPAQRQGTVGAGIYAPQGYTRDGRVDPSRGGWVENAVGNAGASGGYAYGPQASDRGLPVDRDVGPRGYTEDRDPRRTQNVERSAQVPRGAYDDRGRERFSGQPGGQRGQRIVTYKAEAPVTYRLAEDMLRRAKNVKKIAKILKGKIAKARNLRRVVAHYLHLASAEHAMSKAGRHQMDDELRDLKLRFDLLEGDRKAYYETSQWAIRTNKEDISRLRSQNKDLSEAVGRLKKNETDAQNRLALTELERLDHRICEIHRKHDDLQAEAKRKDARLRKKRDLLEGLKREAEAVKSNVQNSSQAKEVRTLQNRLDKGMIKFNEAHSIRKTYEHIVERLQEERLSFDGQLATFEKTLKAKKQDLLDLETMSRDANLAKELAKAELAKFEQQLNEDRKFREKDLHARRAMVKQKVEVHDKMMDAKSSRLGDHNADVGSNAAMNYDESKDKKMAEYEETMRLIKEATGFSDINEVIAKFQSQGDTHNHLVKLQEQHEARLEELTKRRIEVLANFEELKYSGESRTLHSERMIDGFQQHLGEAGVRVQESKHKYDRVAKLMADTQAGIKHLCDKLDLIQLPEESAKMQMGDDTVKQILETCVAKLDMIGKNLQGKELSEISTVDEDDNDEDSTEVPDRNSIKKRINQLLNTHVKTGQHKKHKKKKEVAA